MKKIGVFALMVIGMLTMTTLVSAFMGFGNFDNRDEIDAAIESDDYSAWKRAMSNTLTEDRFNEMKQRHSQNSGKRDLMRTAIDSGDYDAYKEIVEEISDERFEVLTEEDFNTLVEIHQARNDGDFELVHELMEDVDFQLPGMGKGMMQGEGSFRGMHGQGKGQGRMAFN